jgi:putative iron-only hydrogenase system regulator
MGAFFVFRRHEEISLGICMKGVLKMDRVALIGIIVHDKSVVDELNKILSQFGQYIIGRMGLPYEKRNLSIISIAVDAPQDIISSLSGKLGMLKGVSAKTLYS